MALIACPECGKKMSSKAVMCIHCGFTSGEVSKEQLDVMRIRAEREKIYKLNMISYAVITLFVAGFGWFWWESEGFQHISSRGPSIMMGCAAVAYLVVRVLLFRHRQKRKALQKATKWVS
jgi:hypothetical protein